MRKRRKFAIRTLLVIIAVIIVIHIVSALTLDRMVEYKEISLSSPRLPQNMDGYVIAFITDTHYISVARLNKIVERINARGVDLLALGGDYPDDDASTTLAVLSGITTTDGVFGVGGNHDDYHDLSQAMSRHGFTHLDNKGFFLKPGFYLAGVEYARKGPIKGDIEVALSHVNADDFILLLSHKPDIAMESKGGFIDLMLCGHTHGGQVTLFGLWSPAMWPFRHNSDYGTRFMKGWTKGYAGTNVYVSRGLGQLRFTPRVFARPEVTFGNLSKFIIWPSLPNNLFRM